MLLKKSIITVLIAVLALTVAPMGFAQDDGGLGLPLLEQLPADVQAY